MGAENHADYLAAITDPETVRAMLEDYRAGLGVDRAAEEADRAAGRRIACPTLVLWSTRDDLEELFGDPRPIWAAWTTTCAAGPIDSGHHMAEDAPEELVSRWLRFLGSDHLSSGVWAIPPRGEVMPKTTKTGKPKQDELPSTLQRSPKKAQRTFTKAYDAAADQYGSRSGPTRWRGRRSSTPTRRSATTGRRRSSMGPSDEQAERGRNTNPKTKGGVDANATKTHLLKVAQSLGVSGRSTMKKKELVDAIQKANNKKTAAARKK